MIATEMAIFFVWVLLGGPRLSISSPMKERDNLQTEALREARGRKSEFKLRYVFWFFIISTRLLVREREASRSPISGNASKKARFSLFDRARNTFLVNFLVKINFFFL